MASLATIDLLRRLVAFDTTSRNSNVALADFVCEYLDRPGVRITRNPSPDGTKTNVVVLTGPDPDPEARHGLLLSGHMDVVPADETEWMSDPFTLTDVDDRLVGRGACDMKGFLALAVNTIAALDGETLAHPCGLLLTFDEEVGTLGAKHFVESLAGSLTLPRRVIIGEPTDFAVVRMHKGHLRLQLDIEGTAAHSGFPQSGESAIEPMARAVTALAALRETLQEEPAPHGSHFGRVPFVTLNVAQIRGGAATNVIPDHCALDIGIRLLPDMTSEGIVERVRHAVADALDGRAFALSVVNDSPPMLLPEDHALYRSLSSALDQDDTQSVYYATDAGWLSRAGFDCVVCGPGNMDTAHKPNEWIPIAALARGEGIVADAVARYCAGSTAG